MRARHKREVGTAAVVGVMIFSIWAVGVLVRDYVEDGTRRWFAADLPPVEEVRTWSQEELDTRLHGLSRWNGMSARQWHSFVFDQIQGLHIDPRSSFRMLEVGVGVGAFARVVLELFPNATGAGIDTEPAVVAIAAAVLPPSRFTVTVGDMVDLNEDDASYDVVFIPGAICYLHTAGAVEVAITEAARVLKPGGGLCVSMLPPSEGDMGSCNVRVPKAVWLSRLVRALGLILVSMDDMNDWGLPHAMGRYSVCLHKHA